jgi:3-oxoacyl-[acyl-carrier protein] reductase
LDLGLQGRVAIVAAASKGLGRAVAEELAREGASVAICARTASELEEAAAAIHKSTDREVFHQAVDVTNPAAVSHFVSAVDNRFGRIDICVTNSGGPPSKLFVDSRPEDWRGAVDLLLMSAVYFAKETLPRMQKNKWGRFITITSSAVKQPVDGLLFSNSVRAAVTGLARTLANEYAAHGITVNNVCPGYTRTAHRRKTRSRLRRLDAPNPRGPHRHAARIRRRRGLPRFGARQLRERHFHRDRWRHGQESPLAR